MRKASARYRGCSFPTLPIVAFRKFVRLGTCCSARVVADRSPFRFQLTAVPKAVVKKLGKCRAGRILQGQAIAVQQSVHDLAALKQSRSSSFVHHKSKSTIRIKRVAANGSSRIVVPSLSLCDIGSAANGLSTVARHPVSDIDTAVVDSLKALDPKRPIRKADMGFRSRTA